ncbi:hypothetical protein G6O69_07480 [Pseudenhygromyxa sp. WMMC2535]|uniref:hypothetical protein n=1 Tax=Pseudenhygromyxa sp. WMMC2535 TaxID=2712867 RepID=UPI0015564AEC|nr:hypothetical protein [Pseudenhygromyxa sp. WMMC2535]NVB37669.1 hypothetical protein [Pseudenhygromyxa sp. WMMC2535]
MRHIYDDEKITLEAKVDGTPTAVAKIKTVDFLVTTKAEDVETEKPPISAPVEVGFPASSASHEYTPDPVADANDYYDLTYKAKITPPGRDPILQSGSEEFRIWPTKIELTFEADDNEAHKTAKFKWVQGGSEGPVEKSDDSGKWSQRLAKKTFEVKMVAPWAFDGDVTHAGCKRTYKVKRNPYEFEFIAPEVADATQKTKQYVNLDPDAAGWSQDKPFGHVLEFKVGGKGDEDRDAAERLAQENDTVFIEIEFTPATKRNDPKPKLLDDGLDGAAAGSNSDKTWKGKAKLDANGQATFKVELGYAGGDVCKVKIGYDDACGDASLEFETWRRLSYELLYADVQAPEMLDAGGGQRDLPQGIKTAADTRLGAACIEYKLAAAHQYREAQAKAGTIVDAAWIGKAGRKRVLSGGRLDSTDPVAFNAENDRTIHIKMVDACFSSHVSTNNQAPQLDASPFVWQSQDYLIPFRHDVSGKTWEAVIATPDNYKGHPTLSFTAQTYSDVVNRAYTFEIRETTQGKTLTLSYGRKPDQSPEDALAVTEEAKIGPFIQSLLTVADVRKQNNVIELELKHPSNAGARAADVQGKLQASFDANKPEIYTHPGLNDDGSLKSGNVDAGWFVAKSFDKAEITLPTSATSDGSEPGDFVGPLSATKCPVKVQFKVDETYAINGSSSGVRQLFCKDPDRVDGALASTLCHELGHSMGMTIMSGRSKIPPGEDPAQHVDDGGTYYLNGSAPYTNGIRNIGVGPHCAEGVPGGDRADSRFNGKSGSCVMFHSGGNTDSRPSYCDTCKNYLKARKLTDIRSSWNGRADADY